MNEDIQMSAKEVDRWYLVKQAMERKMKQAVIAEELGMTERQVRRLVARGRKEGKRGMQHGLKGRVSRKRIGAEERKAVAGVIRERYGDFGPTLAQEYLEKGGTTAWSVSTVRRVMMEEKIWQAKRGKKRHRSWRERRRNEGLMVQMDGSEHDWFEGRGPRCWLVICVDDATSKIKCARFEDSEDTATMMGLAKRYIERYGRPGSFYVDRDSIYRTNRQATVDEELRDRQAETQFGRALRELDIRLICALSPQAKGRVERQFNTFQDRLVKALRLAGISAKEEGNRFLETYLPEHNGRYGVEAADPADAHRPLLKEQRLEEIFSARTPRVVGNDQTVQYQNRVFQLLREQPTRVYAKATVEVEERLDGSVHVRRKGTYLNIVELTAASVERRRRQRVKAKRRARATGWRTPLVPPPDHPWRRFSISTPTRTFAVVEEQASGTAPKTERKKSPRVGSRARAYPTRGVSGSKGRLTQIGHFY
jgi:hypothetical protein